MEGKENDDRDVAGPEALDNGKVPAAWQVTMALDLFSEQYASLLDIFACMFYLLTQMKGSVVYRFGKSELVCRSCLR
jgi:hypothetical protein